VLVRARRNYFDSVALHVQATRAPITEDRLVHEWLAPALGVAVSPLPVAAMLLLLGGERAVAKGAAFWLAWVAGVAVPTAAFVLLAGRLDGNEDAVRPIAVGEIAAGILLVAVVLRHRFGGGVRAGAEPAWLQALDRAGTTRAAALALLLSALNPKNLALMLSGSLLALETGDGEFAALGFVLVAVSTVSGLLGWRVLAARRSAASLGALRRLAARHDGTIGLVLGLLIGVYFGLDGIRRL